MDKKQKSNVGTIFANMERSFFVSKAYWIPASAGMTNTGILQLALKAGFIAVGVFLFFSGSCFGTLREGQEGEIKIVSDSHPLIKKAREEEMAFRVATGQNIQDILNLIKIIYSQTPSIDKEQLKEEILDRMKTDIELFGVLNETLNIHKQNIVVPFPLLHNQMTMAIEGAQPLIESDLDKLLEGKVPQGYQYQLQDVTYLYSNNQDIYGGSKGTFLKTALFNILFQLINHTKALNFDELKRAWAETSPNYHIVPLPQGVGYAQLTQIDERFSDFPYLLGGNDPSEDSFLFFAHSGFSFGGNQYNPKGKLYEPEDCISWIRKITESPYAFTTLDLLYAYRYYLPEKGAYVPEEWPNSPIGQYLKRFKPIAISNPAQDIRPGLIFVEKSFSNDDPTMKNTVGIGGHAALVLNLSKNGTTIDTLSYARNMPVFEGFGVAAFTFQTGFPVKAMFFSVED